jgi:hypothetical protein
MLAGLDLSHRFSARVRSHVLLQSPPVLVLVDLSVDSFSSSLTSTGSHAEWSNCIGQLSFPIFSLRRRASISFSAAAAGHHSFS